MSWYFNNVHYAQLQVNNYLCAFCTFFYKKKNVMQPMRRLNERVQSGPLMGNVMPVQRIPLAGVAGGADYTGGIDRVVSAIKQGRDRKLEKAANASAPYKLGGAFPKAPSMGMNFLRAALGR
jgi:hypothetical protein